MGWFFKQKKKEDDIENRLQFSKKLQAVTNSIHATDNLDQIMLDLSQEICDLFNCDRLTVYAVSKDKDFIFSKVKTGIESNNNLVLPIDAQSIAGYVAMSRKSIRIRDVYDTAELRSHAPELAFRDVVDRITGYRTKQVLAAPILNARSGELLGVVQLLNNRSDGAFTEFTEVRLEELCETMAIAYRQRTKALAPVRSKYDGLIASGIISGPELELAIRSSQRKQIDLEDVLIDEFQVPVRAIGEALSKTFNFPYEGYKAGRRAPDSLSRKLKREFAERNQWLPLEEERNVLTVVTTNLEHDSTMRQISEIYPYSTLLYRITTKREFRQTLDDFFGR